VLFGGIAGWLALKGFRAGSDARSGYLVGVVLLAPLLAWFASRLLIHGGFAFGSRARGNAKKKWNGIYYEYATIHLRAVEHEEALVFIEDDILSVIEQPHSETIKLFGPAERLTIEGGKWRVLTEQGCERLLLKCPHVQAKGLLLYLRREAFGPYAKRRERFGR
jgi:hypothetical protein